MNYHHHLPATALWGDGTFASSDGQRFPVQVKAANAREGLFALDEIFALRDRYTARAGEAGNKARTITYGFFRPPRQR